MKILLTVEFYYPSIGGVQEVVKQISERLVKNGHDVTVATTKLTEREKKTINGVKIVEFDIKGNLIRGITGEIENYQRFLINSGYDIIVNFAAQQWASDLAFSILDRIKAKKIFVPTGFSEFYSEKYKDYFEKMKIWMKKYDMNIFLSNRYRDIDFARKIGVKKICVIPNGASEVEFLAPKKTSIRKKYNIPDNHFLLLHVGSHTGLKGHKEAIEMFDKAKITNATFLIIGNSFGRGCARNCSIQEKIFNLSPKRLIDKKKLIVSALTRQETVDAYKEAGLFLFPSNIECSALVLFECLASKTPFLTSDAGNSREIIKWANSGLLLPTFKEKNGYGKVDINKSARILEMIFHNEDKRISMAKRGFLAWKNKFTWKKIVKHYEDLFKDLLSYTS